MSLQIRRRSVVVAGFALAVITLVALLLAHVRAQAGGADAAYAFSEGAGTVSADVSGNGNSATLVNGTAWNAAGRYGSALEFDGANDGVRLPVSPPLALTNAFTIEAWVRPVADPGSARMIVQMPGANGDGLRLIADGRPRFRAASSAGSMEVTGPSPLPINAWTHLGVTYDGTQLRLYVDGHEATTQTASGSVSGTQNIWFGRARGGGSPFAGLLDEVRIYRRALTANEVFLDLNTPIDPAAPFQVTTESPVQDNRGVITTPVTATFSKPISSGSLTSSTFVLLDAMHNAVPATVSYNPATRTARLMPEGVLAPLTTYTAGVRGDGGGVTDSTGGELDNDTEWSFTTAASDTVPSAAYAFSEGSGTTTADSSGNGQTATLVGDPQWTGGEFGAALYFGGGDAGVTIPVNDALKLTTAFTLEAWVQPISDSGARQIIQLPGPNGDGLRLNANGRPRFIGTFPGGSADVIGPYALPVNAWSHLAVTYDGAMLRLFVGGVQVATRAVVGGISGTQAMALGQTRNGTNPFIGVLDEVRIYRRALTAGDLALNGNTPVDDASPFQVTRMTPVPNAIGVVTTPVAATFSRAASEASVTDTSFVLLDGAHAQVPAAVSYDVATRTATLTPFAGLAPHTTYAARVLGGSGGVLDSTGNELAGDSEWSFQTAVEESVPSAAYGLNEGSGVETEDASGNGHTGTLVAGPIWTADGEFGSALIFDGVDDGVSLPASDALTFTSAFTVEAWVRPSVETSNARQIVQMPGAGGDGLRIAVNGRPRFWATFPGRRVSVTGPAVLPINEWTHLATTYDGATLRMYVNGAQVATRTVAGELTGSLAMSLGRTRLGGNPFLGTLDEVRIYRRTLAADEIATDMVTPLGVPPPPPPQPVSLTVTPVGASIVTNSWWQFNARATLSDGSTSDVTADATWTSSNEAVTTVSAGLATGVGPGLATVTATLGALSASSNIQVADGAPLPQDPTWVATALNPSVATQISQSTRFLYTGSDPIQRGVTDGAIDPGRAAVVRGQTTTRDGAPLPGVTVAIAGRPEFGTTQSRGDGMFDLAVNGGAILIVHYTKSGYLPVDRQVEVPRGDFVVAPEVALIQLDAQVTTISAEGVAPLQVAKGSVVTDDSGTRQATVVFPQGTTAVMTLPNGTTQPLETLHVRATEFTVGEGGAAAMPATLPVTSAYTYAVDLSVDEAIGAGATTVTFSAPVPVYVQNFLGFPVGTAVPSGYYDPQVAAWLPMPNGVVLKVLATDGSGRADVDLDGDGEPDDTAALAAVGITDAERTMLASTYTSGQTLWRVPVPHFSVMDFNWPYLPPRDYHSSSNVQLDTPQQDTNSEVTCAASGSIIECQDQVLGERLSVAGTSLTLNYRSDRVPGRVASRSAKIQIGEANPSPSLKRIELVVSIAGREITQTFPPSAGLAPTFVWDGLDAYGRPMEGFHVADITIRHIYDAFYTGPAFAPATAPAFGQPSANPLGVASRREYPVEMHATVRLGSPPRSSSSLAGWSLDAHHVYDPVTGSLFMGDGQRRTAATLDGLRTIADAPYAFGMASDGAGAVYYVQWMGNGYSIRKTVPGGQTTTIAGPLNNPPHNLAVAEDGTLYYTNYFANVFTCQGMDAEYVFLYRRSPNGPEELLAQTMLPYASQCDAVGTTMGRAADGTIYIAAGRYVLRFNGSTLDLVTETGNEMWIWAVAARSANDVYLGFYDEARIDHMDAGGQMTRFAGTGTLGFSGDGGPALAAEMDRVTNLAVATDGSVLALTLGERANRIRRIATDGTIFTVAGGAPFSSTAQVGEGSPASALTQVNGVGTGPNGAIYVSDTNRVYEVRPEFHGTPDVFRRVVSSDGAQVYEFSEAGNHLRTRSSITGAVLSSFTYDPHGNVTSVRDGDGLVTTIQRTGDGTPTAVVAPFGQQTSVAVDGNGWLAGLTAPGARTTTFTSTAGGLLTQMVDPKGQPHTFTYDAAGRLAQDQDPAGGSQTLARTEFDRGWLASRTTALGRVRSYRTDLLPGGAQQMRFTESDGTQTVQTRGVDGAVDVRSADGMHTVMAMAGDPRFGLQAPLPASVTVSTPGGVTLTSTTTRTATFSNPQDVASLKTQTETRVVNGRTTQTVFDAATRTYTATSPAGRSSTSRIDPQGRITHTQTGALTPVDYTYDPQGRLTDITQGSRHSSISYDASGRPSILTDALSRGTSFGYDAADRVATQTLPDASAFSLAYDANGNVTSLTPPGRPAHTFTYTSVDQPSSYVPPIVAGTGPTQYSFDVDGASASLARPDGQTTTYTRATNGRLTEVNFSRGALRYSYDAAGRVIGLSDPGGVNLAFAYDGALPVGETWSGPFTGAVSRSFTNNFELASEQVNGALGVTFDYDADRLLTQAGALAIGRDPSQGMVTGTTLGATTEAFEYNGFGEPTRQTAQVAGANVFDAQITRDALGRITQRIEVVDGITRVFEYLYDAAGRLSLVRRNGTMVVLYTYDANGNRLSAEGEAGLFQGTYDAQDRALTYGNASYGYAPSGELATKTIGTQATSYAYDTLGNLIQVTKPNGTIVSYTIDGRGRRVRKSIDGVPVKGWLYADQLRPIAELDGNGEVVSRFVYGTRANVPAYVVKGGVTYRIFSDHLGSPRIVVNAATGEVVQRMDFQPFGEIIQDSSPGWQPFGFAGGLYDPDTGLVRFGARDYDPQLGRWSAKDPIGFDGGDTGLYGYALEDPENGIDPQGTFGITPYDDIIGQGLGIVGEGLIGAAQGLAASIDGAIPFFDPLQSAGLYNENCYGLSFSKIVGGAAIGILTSVGGLRGAAELAEGAEEGTLGYLLNHNRYVRVGPGKMPGFKGVKTPRLSIGNGPKSPLNHFDLRIFGK